LSRDRLLSDVVSRNSGNSKILVENDKVVGVRLRDSSEHKADIVISAADGRSTIFEWLDGRYVDDRVRGYYEKLPVFPPIVFVSLGVAADLGEEPTLISYPIKNQIRIGNSQYERMTVRNHSYDPTLATVHARNNAREIQTDAAFSFKLLYGRSMARPRRRIAGRSRFRTKGCQAAV
jgi:phytoene dehydrogenase-like protein